MFYSVFCDQNHYHEAFLFLWMVCKGYGVRCKAPRRRQKRHVDAEADDGHEAVDEPADELEAVQRQRPAVDPGVKRRSEQLISAAGALRGRPSAVSPEAVQLQTHTQTLFINTARSFVTLDHKTSHKGPFLKIEIYASSESWINKLSIDVCYKFDCNI